MADAGLQQGAARAEQLRRAGQRARLARPRHRSGRRWALGQHLVAAGLRQRAGRVHRPVPGARRGQPHGAGLGQQDQPGRVGVRRIGSHGGRARVAIRSPAARPRRRPGFDPWKTRPNAAAASTASARSATRRTNRLP